mmetsp:Transcript_48384/g.48724  ORF Transcript_48384/g.48724 Transcript_48384/m.48724 type:complete len:157 (-) Transcript_48384:9-479(-)
MKIWPPSPTHSQSLHDLHRRKYPHPHSRTHLLSFFSAWEFRSLLWVMKTYKIVVPFPTLGNNAKGKVALNVTSFQRRLLVSFSTNHNEDNEVTLTSAASARQSIKGSCLDKKNNWIVKSKQQLSTSKFPPNGGSASASGSKATATATLWRSQRRSN